MGQKIRRSFRPSCAVFSKGGFLGHLQRARLEESSMKYLPIACVICGLATSLSAGTITILNPNFDAQVLAPGTATGYGFIPITDWSQNEATNTDYSVYNPRSEEHTSELQSLRHL